MKVLKKTFLILILTLTLIISGCSFFKKSFKRFTKELFLDMMSSPIDANFLIKDLESYGLTKLKVQPLSFSKEEATLYYNYLKYQKQMLKTYDYQKLTSEEQFTYDVLLDFFEVSLSYENFFYYSNPLGSYLGYQAQLPLILAEYHFYTRKDIENYLEYLRITLDSFTNIIAFEKKKVEKGLGMNDTMIDGIIEQCENFLNAEENYLIPVFRDKIEKVDFLTLEEKTSYQSKNTEYINKHFLPAYQFLIDEVKKLKGKALNNQGIAHFKKGKEYYQVLFRDATGTKMSVTEAESYLENKFDQEYAEFIRIFSQNPHFYEQLGELNIFPNNTYQETINFYKSNYDKDFPEIASFDVKIENIHESLEENSSPAMYFLSPIDADVTEVIYVNDKMFADDSTYAFFTLAHEGIPGHLLQHLVLKNSSLPEIRKIMNYKAYSEGWAIYVENYVGKYLDLNQDLLKIYHINDRLTYVFFCLADIGINYQGWSLEEFSEVMQEFFNLTPQEEEQIYYQLIEIATNYLEYYFGYYQLIDLKEDFFRLAETKGLANLDYEFHTFYLESGPTPFYILKERINTYLEKRIEP
jgi:uncharacterized protein (DUF885 family)